MVNSRTARERFFMRVLLKEGFKCSAMGYSHPGSGLEASGILSRKTKTRRRFMSSNTRRQAAKGDSGRAQSEASLRSEDNAWRVFTVTCEPWIKLSYFSSGFPQMRGDRIRLQRLVPTCASTCQHFSVQRDMSFTPKCDRRR